MLWVAVGSCGLLWVNVGVTVGCCALLWVAAGCCGLLWVAVAVAVAVGCCGLLWVAVGVETVLPLLPHVLNDSQTVLCFPVQRCPGLRALGPKVGLRVPSKTLRLSTDPK